MEMKLSITCFTDRIKDKEEVFDKSIEYKKKTKCRYSNHGYYKGQMECVYFHSDKICDKVLSNSKCHQRHPRDCKHWMGHSRGCLRRIKCKYLHNPSKKGKNIKTYKEEKIKSEGLSKKDGKEVTIEKKVDKVIDSL